MGPKLPERQVRINEQFSEDLAEIKTRQLFTGQALGAVVELLDGLIQRLQTEGVIGEDDPVVREYRRGIAEVKRLGLKMEKPVDPEAAVLQVKCPQCQAVLKAREGTRIERCDWCGWVFPDF